MFEITMLAGFLIAGISQLIPAAKKASGPVESPVSRCKSSGKRQSEANQEMRRQVIGKYVATCHQVKAA